MSKETTRAPAAAVGNVVKLRSRKAKLTPSETEALDRFNARRLEVALIQWPEIPPPRDWDSQTNEELADIDFEAIAEFRGDGHGCGTPEFRSALESYFHVSTPQPVMLWRYSGFRERSWCRPQRLLMILRRTARRPSHSCCTTDLVIRYVSCSASEPPKCGTLWRLRCTKWSRRRKTKRKQRQFCRRRREPWPPTSFTFPARRKRRHVPYISRGRKYQAHRERTDAKSCASPSKTECTRPYF